MNHLGSRLAVFFVCVFCFDHPLALVSWQNKVSNINSIFHIISGTKGKMPLPKKLPSFYNLLMVECNYFDFKTYSLSEWKFSCGAYSMLNKFVLYIFLIFNFLFLFIFGENVSFFIVVHLHLSCLSPPPFPQSIPPFSMPMSLLFMFFDLPLPLLSPIISFLPPLWSLAVCSSFQCLWFYFACLFVLLIRFHL